MELSTRALSVLCAVVELNIRSGAPVPSRRVAEFSGLGLSPATMRNIMAELDESGLLSRPHASAGSVPSDRGFRVFVDTVPRRRIPPAAVRRQLGKRMVSMRRELIEDIEWVAQLVAEATREAGVAVRPIDEVPVLEAVSLVLLDDRRVLGVVVTGDGAVEKRLITLAGGQTREELQGLANFLTRTLGGSSIDSIEERLGEAADEFLTDEAREVARQLFDLDTDDVEIRVAGTTNLLETADFSEVDRVRSLLSSLQDRTRLAREFRHAFTRGRTQVLIGEESETTAPGNLGIVATLFFKNGRRAGAVGVVGPSRMNYPRIIPMVEYIGDTLTQMLESSGERYA